MCEHNDYDGYFEVCNDCGMSGKQIHDGECVRAGFVTDADGCCERCGTILQEAA